MLRGQEPQARPDGPARADRPGTGMDGALAGGGRNPLLGAGDEPDGEHPAPGDHRAPPVPRVDPGHGLGCGLCAPGMVLCHPVGAASARNHSRAPADRLPVRPARLAGPLLRRAVVDPGRVEPPLRPEDPAGRARAPGELRLLAPPGHPPLTACFDDPRDILGDLPAAPGQAAAFARWAAEPANRSDDSRRAPGTAGPHLVNADLRAVADLFEFVAASPSDTRRVLGPSPWDGVTQAHAVSWYRKVTRIPHQPVRTDIHYVDDHALAQILAALPLLGMPRSRQMTITRGD